MKILSKRTVILCGNEDERNAILTSLEDKGVGRVGKNHAFVNAPHIDYHVEQNEYQTISKDSFVFTKISEKGSKGKIDLINAIDIL